MNEAVFSGRTTALLEQAEAICAGRGTRLTELRRHVLGLVLDSDRPAGAYDMLERLRPGRKGAAPPTIYRALEFLLDQGLIHKVERLSAYVGCVHGMEDGHAHNAQFLICTGCGRVEELDDHAIGRALLQAAGQRASASSGRSWRRKGCVRLAPAWPERCRPRAPYRALASARGDVAGEFRHAGMACAARAGRPARPRAPGVGVAGAEQDGHARAGFRCAASATSAPDMPGMT